MKIIELSEIKNIINSNSIVAIGGFTINRKPLDIISENISKAKISRMEMERTCRTSCA